MTPLFKPQAPVQISANLLKVFKGTLPKHYGEQLINAVKNNQWICLNLDDFAWANAVLWVKETAKFFDSKGLNTFKQVVMADVDKLDTSQIIIAQTEFGLAGGHFYPYKNKTFEEAATDFDKDVQEEINDFENVKEDMRKKAA